MKNDKKILLLLLLTIPLFSISQSIGRYSFTSTSGFYSNDVCVDFSIGQTIVNPLKRYSFTSTSGFYSNDVCVDFSIGQTIVNPLKNNNILTSGFQQEEISKKNIEYKVEEINLNFVLFPNPIKNIAYISVTSDEILNDVFARVFSIDGKEVQITQELFNYDNFCKIKLDFSSLEIGNYIIKTYINNTLTKSFTVIKN